MDFVVKIIQNCEGTSLPCLLINENLYYFDVTRGAAPIEKKQEEEEEEEEAIEKITYVTVAEADVKLANCYFNAKNMDYPQLFKLGNDCYQFGHHYFISPKTQNDVAILRAVAQKGWIRDLTYFDEIYNSDYFSSFKFDYSESHFRFNYASEADNADTINNECSEDVIFFIKGRHIFLNENPKITGFKPEKFLIIDFKDVENIPNEVFKKYHPSLLYRHKDKAALYYKNEVDLSTSIPRDLTVVFNIPKNYTHQQLLEMYDTANCVIQIKIPHICLPTRQAVVLVYFDKDHADDFKKYDSTLFDGAYLTYIYYKTCFIWKQFRMECFPTLKDTKVSDFSASMCSELIYPKTYHARLLYATYANSNTINWGCKCIPKELFCGNEIRHFPINRNSYIQCLTKGFAEMGLTKSFTFEFNDKRELRKISKRVEGRYIIVEKTLFISTDQFVCFYENNAKLESKLYKELHIDNDYEEEEEDL